MPNRANHRMGPSDVVILVLGMTGSGKSQFISKLTGAETGVGHNLQSGTVSLDLYSCVENGRRIFVADTPGFGDTRRPDVEILKDIAFFLGQIYRHNVRLGGILYLHPITDNRVSGSALRTFHLLRALCGPQALKCAALVTTKWDSLRSAKDDLAATDRENELKYTSNFWGLMRQQGSQVHRWFGSESSARSIVRELFQSSYQSTSLPVLQIQRELIDENRPLDDTTAGREVMSRYGVAYQKLKRDIEDLKDHLSATNLTPEEFSESDRELNRLMDELNATEELHQGLQVSTQNLFDEKQSQYSEMYQGTIRELTDRLSRCEERLSQLGPAMEDPFLAQAASAVAEGTRTAPSRWTRTKLFLRQNILPLLGILAGIGVVAAGAAVINPHLVTAGAQLCALSFSGVEWPSQPRTGAGGTELVGGFGEVMRACPPTPISPGFRMCW
ncbi:P-loop containing nucleoside triphosphate hydrolase protein [Sordaria brevicollis]|uniref:P-loop containing nucleoside triphosphate hydrolase protein n=1 Tax=Sordaria brevicollis TaxID=83679 RepID=A0AAE0UF56_SORBR|nr:P-loop containing nucleoside triphosphate hydrolase protein [Sordaria brevicollis]